jgi:hypothetical protein
MRICLVVVTLVATIVFCTPSAASAQSPNRLQLTAELTAALEEYVAAFSDGRAEFIADSVYTAPAYFFGGGDVVVRMTSAEVQSHFERMMAPLPAQGYARSEIRGSDVCILSDLAALVTLDFARLRADDSVIIEGTAIYFYAKTAEGWRINASIGSSQRIECSG